MFSLSMANKLLTLRTVRTNLSLQLLSQKKSFGPNYYRDKTWWTTRQLKRLFMRFPTLEKIAVLAVLFSMIIVPFGIQRNRLIKARKNLSEDEWADFQQKHKAVITGRIKFGQNMYLPFYNKDKALEQDEETQKTFMDS